jgi:hypothetical protein
VVPASTARQLGNEATVENQRLGKEATNNDQAWSGVRLRGSARVSSRWFCWSEQGFLPSQEMQGGHSVLDHFSCLSFVHLQESTKGAKTLLAKRAFKADAASFGVEVLNCHADNGRFAKRMFLEHASKNGQTVSLCGVNAHFQNGITKKRIGGLTA